MCPPFDTHHIRRADDIESTDRWTLTDNWPITMRKSCLHSLIMNRLWNQEAVVVAHLADTVQSAANTFGLDVIIIIAMIRTSLGCGAYYYQSQYYSVYDRYNRINGLIAYMDDDKSMSNPFTVYYQSTRLFISPVWRISRSYLDPVAATAAAEEDGACDRRDGMDGD